MEQSLIEHRGYDQFDQNGEAFDNKRIENETSADTTVMGQHLLCELSAIPEVSDIDLNMEGAHNQIN